MFSETLELPISNPYGNWEVCYSPVVEYFPRETKKASCVAQAIVIAMGTSDKSKFQLPED